MKKYMTPTLELHVINSEDIMTTSGDEKFVGFNNNNSYAGDHIDFSGIYDL